MAVLNVQSVGSGTGSKHPEAAAALLSPLAKLLAGQIEGSIEQGRANKMAPETAKTLNKVLGIPETVEEQDQVQTPSTLDGTTSGAEQPSVSVTSPNPAAFSPTSFRGMTRPQQSTLISQMLEKQASPTNYKLLADKAYGELLTNQNLTGNQTGGLEKVLALDPASFKDYQDRMNKKAEGPALSEYDRLKNVPGQEENRSYLSDFLKGIDPKLGEYGTASTLTGKMDESGKFTMMPQTKGGTPYSVVRNRLGETQVQGPTVDQAVRLESLAKTRRGRAFDLESGKTRQVTVAESNAEPDRYLDATDADVSALKKHQEYSAGIARFVNRLDTLGETIKNHLTTSGLSQSNKFGNYVVGDLIKNKLLSDADRLNLENMIQGYGMELGKTESGSIGIAGATVEAMKRFTIPNNMPASELIKFLDTSRSVGKSVTDAMEKTKGDVLKNIYEGTGYEIPQHLAGKMQAASAGGATIPRNPGESIADYLKRTRQ